MGNTSVNVSIGDALKFRDLQGNKVLSILSGLKVSKKFTMNDLEPCVELDLDGLGKKLNVGTLIESPGLKNAWKSYKYWQGCVNEKRRDVEFRDVYGVDRESIRKSSRGRGSARKLQAALTATTNGRGL